MELVHIRQWFHRGVKDALIHARTHPEDSRVVMDISPWCRFVNCQILHFRGTKDDVLVRLLHRRDELFWGPRGRDTSVTQKSSSKLRVSSQKEGSGKIHTVSMRSRMIELCSFTSANSSSRRDMVTGQRETYRRDSVPIEYTAVNLSNPGKAPYVT